MTNQKRATEIVEIGSQGRVAMIKKIESALDEAEERGRQSVVLLASAKEQLLANFIALKILDAYVSIQRAEIEKVRELLVELPEPEHTTRCLDSSSGRCTCGAEAGFEAIQILDGWLKESK